VGGGKRPIQKSPSGRLIPAGISWGPIPHNLPNGRKGDCVLLQEVAKVVTYTRVSTAKQGRSGLGLEAQAKLLADYVAFHNARVVAEFEEVKSGLKDHCWQALPPAECPRSMRGLRRRHAAWPARVPRSPDMYHG
jgi:Resolvase, N terminal domain